MTAGLTRPPQMHHNRWADQAPFQQDLEPHLLGYCEVAGWLPLRLRCPRETPGVWESQRVRWVRSDLVLR